MNYLVIGAGNAGRPVARLLNNQNHKVIITDPKQLSDFKQDVQTYIFFAPPSVLTLTDFTFDFHILFERLCEWLTALPK